MTENGDDRFSLVLRAALCGLVVIVPLVFSPSLSDYNTPKSIVFLVLTAVVAAGLLTQMVLRGEIYVIDTPLTYSVLAFLAINFISLYQAHNIYQGLQALLEYLFHFILLLVTFHLVVHRGHALSVVSAAVLGGGIIAVIGLLQHNGVYHFYHPWKIPVATIGNVNFVAEYLNVVYPLSLALLIVTRSVWGKVASLAAVFVMSCYLVVLGSRGGWLGAILTFAVFGAAFLLRHIENQRRVLDLAVAGLLVFTLCLPVLRRFGETIPAGNGNDLASVVGVYWDGVVSRSEDALKLQDDSSRQRVLLWEDTLRLILDKPVVGVGVGNYEFNIPKYYSRESLAVRGRMEEATSRPLMIFRAHNEYLEVWSETGIIGLFIFLFLVGQILKAIYETVLGYVRGDHDELAIGPVAAILATFAHAFFSSNFQDPASSALFWVVVGLVWANGVNYKGRQKIELFETRTDAFSFSVIALAVIGVLGMGFYGVQRWQGSAFYHAGRTSYEGKRYREAIPDLQRALDLLPPRPFAAHELIGKSRFNLDDLDNAVASFERSLQYQPYNAGVLYFLGETLMDLERSEEAVDPLRQAVDLAPLNAEYVRGYGAALGLSGDLLGAVRELERALALEPRSVEALHLLGGNQKKLKNYDAARVAYRRALDMDPGNAEVQNSLGVIDVLTQDYVSAREIFKRLAERFPDRSDFRYNLLVTHFTAGDTVTAVQVGRRLLVDFPDYQPALHFFRDVLKK